MEDTACALLKELIIKSLEQCNDVELLDLIYKLLIANGIM